MAPEATKARLAAPVAKGTPGEVVEAAGPVGEAASVPTVVGRGGAVGAVPLVKMGAGPVPIGGCTGGCTGATGVWLTKAGEVATLVRTVELPGLQRSQHG